MPSQSSTDVAMTGVEETDVEGEEEGELPAANSRTDKGKGRAVEDVEDVEEENFEFAEDSDGLEDLDDLEQLDLEEAIARSRQPQYPGNQGEGSGSTQAQVSTVVQPEAPFTAQELIDELIGLMPGVPQASVAPVGLLGPDVFGDRVVP
ncbi:hypothetical protein, partial [Kitasatospora sp. MY 5-36]|uniref:hypothetical protein n=1 Tax=Kitasatospora sp. MY 5-36 TaxID=1678027 RepID=UPI0018FEFBA9